MKTLINFMFSLFYFYFQNLILKIVFRNITQRGLSFTMRARNIVKEIKEKKFNCNSSMVKANCTCNNIGDKKVYGKVVTYD